MGLSIHLSFVAGVPFEIICGRRRNQVAEVTRYHEDSGAPYQKTVTQTVIPLLNGTNLIATDCYSWYRDVDKYLEGLGLYLAGYESPFCGVVGVQICRSDSEQMGPMYLAAPSDMECANHLKAALDKLVAAGFKVTQSDVKVYSVLVTSS